MAEPTLDSILDLLNQHQRRVTYGAVARVLNKQPTFLMAGRGRDRRHSWVVNSRTGLPTGYEPDQMHPELMANPDVIQTSEALQEWLREVGDVAVATADS